MFSPDTRARASVSEASRDTVELWWIAGEDGLAGLHWTMSRDDAEDLARWWITEDARVKSGQCPVRDKECGNVLVSMFTSSMIHVRVRDRFGNVKVVGYSFPRAVLDRLGRWLSPQRHDTHFFSQSEDT